MIPRRRRRCRWAAPGRAGSSGSGSSSRQGKCAAQLTVIRRRRRLQYPLENGRGRCLESQCAAPVSLWTPAPHLVRAHAAGWEPRADRPLQNIVLVVQVVVQVVIVIVVVVAIAKRGVAHVQAHRGHCAERIMRRRPPETVASTTVGEPPPRWRRIGTCGRDVQVR